MIPAHFKLVYDRNAIASAIERLAKPISRWAEQVQSASQQDVIAIPILRGGMFFAADLLRALSSSVELEPLWTRAYDSAVNAKQHKEVNVELAQINVKSRSVLVIDEICDTGRTLTALKERLLAAGAREVMSVVLIKRVLPDPTFEPDWIGFEYAGAEWFVGYGMEDQGRYRNLAGVYIIQKGL